MLAALPYVEAVFYRVTPFRGTKSYNAQQVPDDQKTFTTEFYADVFQWVQLAFRPHC